MATPFQALIISILHTHLILHAASALLASDESPAPAPAPPGGYTFTLKRAGQKLELHHITLEIHNKPLAAIADTGSDLILLQDSKCSSDPIKCPGEDNKCDKLMKNMKCCSGHCMFERKYGVGGSTSFARGFMVKSEVTIEPDKTAKELNIGCAVNFGCPEVNKKDCQVYMDGGIIGLGRGEMSLLSQLKMNKFSFCLPEDDKPSKIKFGDKAAQPKAEQKVDFIVDKGHGKEDRSSKYLVELKKISMGKRSIDGGVMLIDSGNTYSKLPRDAFEMVTQNLKEKGWTPKVDHEFTCYNDLQKLPTGMPEIVLQFGMPLPEIRLPGEKYMKRTSTGFCLAIKEGPLTLGNFQMQNIPMLFDLTKEPGTLAFLQGDCATFG